MGREPRDSGQDAPFLSVGRRLSRGGFWNAVAELGGQAIGFVTTLFLARALAPSAFGSITQVVVFTGLLGYLVEMGIGPSLIRQSHLNNRDVQTAFWTMMLASAAVYAVAFFGAQGVARFYGDPALLTITRVVFLEFLFRPIKIVVYTLDSREVRYDRHAKANVAGAIGSGVVAILFALANAGVWALVVQIVARSAIAAIVQARLARWRPELILDGFRVRWLLRSGVHFTIDNVAAFASQNADFVVVGRLAGSESLGLYSMAFRLSRYLVLKLQSIVGRMMFPAFTLTGNHEAASRTGYLKASVSIAFVVLPLLSLYAVALPQLVEILVGAKWADAVPIARVLLPYVGLEALSVVDPGFLYARNKVRHVYVVRAIATALIAGVTWLVYGVSGILSVAVCYSIIGGASLLVLKWMALRAAKISIIWYFRAHAGLLALGAFSAVGAAVGSFVGLRLALHPAYVAALASLGWGAFTATGMRVLGLVSGFKLSRNALFRASESPAPGTRSPTDPEHEGEHE